MISTADTVHLRFLHQRVQKGDRLYDEDVAFLQHLDEKIRSLGRILDDIREKLEND